MTWLWMALLLVRNLYQNAMVKELFVPHANRIYFPFSLRNITFCKYETKHPTCTMCFSLSLSPLPSPQDGSTAAVKNCAFCNAGIVVISSSKSISGGVILGIHRQPFIQRILKIVQSKQQETRQEMSGILYNVPQVKAGEMGLIQM